MILFAFDMQSQDVSMHGPCIATAHVLVTLIVLGCMHVCLYFAVGVGLSGECMFHVLIVIFILVLNCEVL